MFCFVSLYNVLQALHALNILKPSQLYEKMKTCFLKQIKLNCFTNDFYSYLRNSYLSSKGNESFIFQIQKLIKDFRCDEEALKYKFDSSIKLNKENEDAIKIQFLIKLLNDENNYNFFKEVFQQTALLF